MFSDHVEKFYQIEVEKAKLVKSAPSAYFRRELNYDDFDNLLNNIIEQNGALTASLDAYNHWIKHLLPKQIMEKSIISTTHVYSFTNVRVLKPTLPNGTPLFPYRARKENLSYSGKIVATVFRRPIGDLAATMKNVAETAGASENDFTEENNYEICSLPIMIGSIACNLYKYTSDELKQVFESEVDLGGYFIIKGAERVNINKENLGFSQQISKEIEQDSFETRITTQTVAGTTVVALNDGKKWPTIKVLIYRSGLKGTTAQHFPLFAVLDLLFQKQNPDLYQYENLERASEFDQNDEITDNDEMLQKRINARRQILHKSMEYIKLFIPQDKWNIVQNALVASIVKYSYILNPIKYIIQKKIKGTNVNTIAGAAAISASKRAASALSTNINNQNDEETELSMQAAVSAASVASSVIADLSSLQKTNLIVQEILSSFFSTIPDIENKIISLCRITAQHLMCGTGLRPLDEQNSWDNRRIKFISDNLSQVLNGNFRLSLSSTLSRVKLTIDPGLSEAFASSFGPIGTKNKDSTVDSAKRDTPVSIIAQFTRIDERNIRMSRQVKNRILQPSQIGYICAAETPCSDSIGITKNLACTASASLKRNPQEYEEEVLKPTLLENSVLISSFQTSDKPHSILLDNFIKGWCDMSVFGPIIRKKTKTNLKFYDAGVVENYDDNILEIYLTGGRPIRPLFTIDDDGLIVNKHLNLLKIGASVMDFVKVGAIEFVHAREQSRYKIIKYRSLVESVLNKRKETVKYYEELKKDPTYVSQNDIIEVDEQYSRKFLPAYSEIDPISLLGISASLAPYANACHGPRVTYQAGMATAALGAFHSTYYDRWDTSYKRTEGDRPTLETRIARPIGSNKFPTGRMYIVAICSLANNGEDGIVFQKESLEQFRVFVYHTHKIIAKPPVMQMTRSSTTAVLVAGEKFVRPEEADMPYHTKMRKQSIYHAIGPDGLPILGSRLEMGDCIVGKVRISVSQAGTEIVKNASVFAGIGDEGIVERVNSVKLSNGTIIVRVKVRQCRPVFVGDKISSRYSQKGTIAAMRSTKGAIMTTKEDLAIDGIDPDDIRRAVENYEVVDAEEAEHLLLSSKFARDLPKIASGPFAGVTPDCFINSAGQPSRMTIGMLMEMLGSKAALFTGERLDGSIFRQPSRDVIESWRQVLANNGCDPDGLETMCHSDGSPMRDGVKVFVAPCFYQTLRHTVTDKIQYRAEGIMTPMTHQPIHGRSRGGGLRIGEMEKNALCAWGMTSMVQDRLMYASDKYMLDVCRTCGNQAYTNHLLGISTCRVCPPNEASVGVLEIPYISILINRMLNGCGIQVRYKFEENNEKNINRPPISST